MCDNDVEKLTPFNERERERFRFSSEAMSLSYRSKNMALKESLISHEFNIFFFLTRDQIREKQLD